MKTLRLQLRFLLPLAVALVGAAYIALPLLDQVTLRWFSRDLNSRGALMVNALSDAVAEALLEPRADRLATLLDRAVQDERLFAIAACDANGVLLHATRSFPDGLSCARSLAIANRTDPRLKLAGGAVHVGIHVVTRPSPDPTGAPWLGAPGASDWAGSGAALATEGRVPSAMEKVPTSPASELVGRLVVLHDMSFIEKRSQDTRRYLIGFIASLGFVIALITVSVAQLSWRGWVKGARAIMRGEGLVSPLLPPPELAPFVDELRNSLRDLEDEYRRMQGPPLEWTGEHLRSLLQTQLRGDQVIVVSNREPYLHEHCPEGIVVRRPASGLVTAVEPVMRACSGTWIAHGSGSADLESVDGNDRVAVPPGMEDYLLRRIWLTPEEEQGYYYGFANEGLWPLCHVAHVRPVFRESDWEAYRQVNQRFADAVVAEARGEDPVVLVQDYHFALLPAMIRAKLPQATVLTFWHIPWPNPESFGICPWHKEILQGMLGSTILGFHTRFHCRNFMETVDRFLEARIEAEYSTISVQDKETLVESYPISIEWPDEARTAAWPSVAQCRQRVVDRLGLPSDLCLAVGVDRFDYTKGILERLNAVERLLEKAPQWIGRFVFVQVAAPTRSSLDEYRSFQDHVERVTERINARFGRPGYRPVHLLAQHHEPDAVNELFRAADICVVTSLHDGMNLVCKEFVAARDDQQGVLVLSRFAGAAREMTEALIVNPYHVEETADALQRAATMPAAEQRERMVSLRSTVREFNVFRWAARMLADAGRWRLRARVEARVRRLGPR
ncbi:alpha,alpha-trehalose-phosphate synthase (UDP-forming) [Roseateles sp. DB2]|uniref:alpha,alpha-trehalose-phosphate synthase (UDP-forming) n=1 Tax=Roseateles sp. DB2 TaxID=3453717 RepID=UPI003EEABC01